MRRCLPIVVAAVALAVVFVLGLVACHPAESRLLVLETWYGATGRLPLRDILALQGARAVVIQDPESLAAREAVVRVREWLPDLATDGCVDLPTSGGVVHITWDRAIGQVTLEPR